MLTSLVLMEASIERFRGLVYDRSGHILVALFWLSALFYDVTFSVEIGCCYSLGSELEIQFVQHGAEA